LKGRHHPIINGNAIIGLETDDRNLELTLWNMTVPEVYDRFRPLLYPNAAVVILAFAIDNRESFRNVSERWLPEILYYFATAMVPIVILGCKADLRRGKEGVLDGAGLLGEVTVEEGRALARQISGAVYAECSAKTGDGIDAALELVARAAIPWNPPKRKTTCMIV
jgi:GTPase SAR1 family protein